MFSKTIRFSSLVSESSQLLTIFIFFNFYFPLTGPEVTQAIKLMNSPDEVNTIFLEPLNPSSRSFIIFAINDNSTTQAGGSHWSLCVFSKVENTFYHLDSSSGINHSPCSSIVKTLKACLGCKTAEIKEVDCLQQTNTYDCGIFLLCHADLVCQTIEKSNELNSIRKLQPKKVHMKRSETVELVQNLSVC